MSRSEKGQTLIELMIIVAIIGILAAVAIPKFQEMKAKVDARKTGGSPASSTTAKKCWACGRAF